MWWRSVRSTDGESPCSTAQGIPRRGRWRVRTADLCRVKVFQGVSLTCGKGQKHALTRDDATYQRSSIRAVSQQNASYARPRACDGAERVGSAVVEHLPVPAFPIGRTVIGVPYVANVAPPPL